MYNILSIGRASAFVSTTQTEEENLCWVRCPPIPLQKISAKVFSEMANGSPWLATNVEKCKCEGQSEPGLANESKRKRN